MRIALASSETQAIDYKVIKIPSADKGIQIPFSLRVFFIRQESSFPVE